MPLPAPGLEPEEGLEPGRDDFQEPPYQSAFYAGITLTPTARRILDTLPAYYHGEPLFERMIQAQANEIDRMDALLDRLAVELQPGAATDDMGLLGMWEQHLDLPPRPPDASVSQRRGKVAAALRAMDSHSASNVLEALTAAVGSGGFTVERDTPDPLIDTLKLPFQPGTYQAILTHRIAQRMWPAHRQLLLQFQGGFILDASPLDISSL